MDKIIEVGGQGFLIPAVLSVAVFYAIRGLFGWHGRRSQHRKEFLELWDSARSQDDFWLEVIVRHLIGTYLPAHVIRLAVSQPDKTQSLIELSELWPLLRYDRSTHTASWCHRRHTTIGKRKAERIVMLAGYFICAVAALFAGWMASQFGPNTFSGWAYGAGTVIFGFLAVTSLMREDTIKIAATAGQDWLDRINRSALPSEKSTESNDGKNRTDINKISS